MNTGEVFDFYVQMPISPKITGILVYDDAIGDRPIAQETSVELVGGLKGIKKYALPPKFKVAELNSPDVKEFMEFAESFCYLLPTLPSNVDGKVYCSSSKKFKIMLNPILTDDAGVEVSTPARIDKYTNVIEVSKRKFSELSVPGRLCILLHEFSHKYMNQNAANELEADLNGLTIYLASGYPRTEAYEVFINTFYGLPTDENLDRFKHIEKFIWNFDDFYRKAS